MQKAKRHISNTVDNAIKRSPEEVTLGITNWIVTPKMTQLNSLNKNRQKQKIDIFQIANKP